MTGKAKVTCEYRLVFIVGDSVWWKKIPYFVSDDHREAAALVDTAAISYHHQYIYCPTAMPPIHILLLHRKPLSGTKNNQYQGSSIGFTQRQ